MDHFNSLFDISDSRENIDANAEFNTGDSYVD